jgi:hypothetical protein
MHGIAATSYAGPEGYDWWGRGGTQLASVFSFPGQNLGSSSTRIKDIRDGTSNTILLGEVTIGGFANGTNFKNGTGKAKGTGNALVRSAFLAIPAGPFNDGGCYSSNEMMPDGTTTACSGNQDWMQNPRPYRPTYIYYGGINMWEYGANSYHVGGVQFLLADGSVRFINQNLDFGTESGMGIPGAGGVWEALNTINGRDTVGEF